MITKVKDGKFILEASSPGEIDSIAMLKNSDEIVDFYCIKFTKKQIIFEPTGILDTAKKEKSKSAYPEFKREK
jgi:hypothetical protein